MFPVLDFPEFMDCIYEKQRLPLGYKKISYSVQLSMKFQLSMKIFRLINVKMPTIVGILTFMSRENSILGLSESEKC